MIECIVEDIIINTHSGRKFKIVGITDINYIIKEIDLDKEEPATFINKDEVDGEWWDNLSVLNRKN